MFWAGYTPEVQGLALIAMGVQFSTVANSAMKTVSDVPVTQAVQLRFIIQFLCSGSVALVMRKRGQDIRLTGQPAHRAFLVARAVSLGLALVCLWTALRVMPIGIATTILYLYPAFTGILAKLFLREDLGWRFWLQASVSFAGVVLTTFATLSSGSVSMLGVCLVLVSAPCFAVTNCLTRTLKGAQTIEVQFFTDTIMAFVIMPTFLVAKGEMFDWTAWNQLDFVKLVGATAAGLTALLIVIRGQQMAAASKATLFAYLEIPGSYVMQLMAFDDIPSPEQMMGAGLIVSAALSRFAYEARSEARSEVKSDKSALCEPLLTDHLDNPQSAV